MKQAKKTITAAVTAAGIAIFAGAADAETIPERLMQDLSRDFQLQSFQAAGVVGNLARETGNFRFMQELEPIVEGSRGGIGYSQWTASRRLAYEEYAGDLDNQLTYETNYGYLKQELTTEYARVMDDLRDTTNLWEATVVFMRGYLKPRRNPDNIRISMNYANDYLSGDFSGSGCQSHHEVRIDGRRMMIAACPDTTIRVGDHSVDVILASVPRPVPRPGSIIAEVQLADATMAGSIRPRSRPEQVGPGPESPVPAAEPAVASLALYEAIEEAVLIALATPPEFLSPRQDEADSEDQPQDPFYASDPLYTRKEDEPEVFAALPETYGPQGMSA